MEWLKPEAFSFETAPLNQAWHPWAAIAVYLTLIIWLERRALTKGVSPTTMYYIRQIQVVHNLLLSVASLIMVAGQFYTSGLLWSGKDAGDLDALSPDFLSCSRQDPPARGRLWYWVYLFYLSKYWELFDTILQMSKGRRPPSYYFHVWHHTMYLVICFWYCKSRASLSPLAVIVNGSVHIVMYYYYHMISRGISPWWKRHIPKMQILQFILGYCFFFHTIKLTYIDKHPCRGKTTLMFHALFNLTMLVGFINILKRITRAHRASVNDKTR